MENLGQRVAIVGAGYAGMAAAVTLAQAGVPATVFESGPLPGGRARRVVSEGEALDNGQHILVGAYAELLRLMRAVGAPQDALLRLPLDLRYFDGFHLRALPLPYPIGLLAGILSARGVSFSERLGAVRFIKFFWKRSFRLEKDIGVEELLREHEQAGRMAHYLWRPLCVSALNTPPQEASARAFLVVLRDSLFGAPGAADLLLPRVDLSALFPEPAARFVQAKGGKVLFRTTIRTLDDVRKEFPKIIVAVGSHQLKALLPELAPEFAYQPITTCYLQYPGHTKLERPMMGLADGLVQWVFDRGQLLGEKGRLACVISAEGDHQQLSREELAAHCHRELAAVLPALASPLWTRVIAEKRATVACTPSRARVAAETPLRGVYLAGDYTDPEYPPTLEAAVRSGVRAAQLALAA